MAIVRIPNEKKTLYDEAAIRQHLTSIGIGYERWEPIRPVADNALPEELLLAYAAEIERLKLRGDYVTADVIDVTSQTPGLSEMLAKFNREHWHDEDEVRFVTRGHGLFYIHPVARPITGIEVGPGDLLTVPRGTLHWFDLCADREIRAIRLFQARAGWTPYYTESGAEGGYQPVCLGLSQIPAQSASL